MSVAGQEWGPGPALPQAPPVQPALKKNYVEVQRYISFKCISDSPYKFLRM